MSNIVRALQILELLVDAPAGARITDLALELSVNRAIPHRLLAELIQLGYVAQDGDTERYRATFKLGSLGLRQLETAGVTRWSQDELDALASASRELVRLAAASGDKLLFVAKAQGANSALIVDSVVGHEVVLHATASGKAWLSTFPRTEARAILSGRSLSRPTTHTKTDLRQVLAELEEVRRLGYAVTNEEMETGINAIAAAIVPPDAPLGRAVGTVSIAGPAARLTSGQLLTFVPAIRATADKLAAQWHVYAYLDALAASGARNTDPSNATAQPGDVGVTANDT